VTDRVPLPTLLSQALVAFTIEFDNESERRIAESGSKRRFLVSLVMWSNLMRIVGDDGVRVGDLPARSGLPGAPVTTGSIHAMLAGMERWGYISVARDLPDTRPKPPRADWVVRATPAGRAAQAIWRPLAGAIEERWNARFGESDVGALRAALAALVGGLDIDLPNYLPIIGFGLRLSVPHLDEWVPTVPAPVPGRAADSGLDLSVLLSRVLLLFTIEFERESKLGLAMSADVLRVVNEEGVRVRDLPALSGVSKEALAASTGFLERQGYAVIEPDPSAARTRLVRLTPKGRAARDAYWRHVDDVEARWRARYRAGAIDRLRAALERLFDHAEGEPPRLAEGLVPSPAGWRNRTQYRAQTEAMQRDPAAALPHHPMVLHRGGWPDGS
jgi:DNA-binding MarR family transcriptional regulator